ncbi:MAG: hypothetical protein WAV00_23545 [Nocardioides sp.]
MPSAPARWWSPPSTAGGPDTSRLIPVAAVMIVAQLAFRAWATYHSYWEGDDFIFINNTFAPGGRSLHTLLTGLSGHVMPAGLYLSWLVNRVSPYSWGLATVVLTLMQAVASVGFLRLLLVAFGRRWGILPPLLLYLVTAFSVQGAVWWGPGIHAFPLQIAFFWGLTSQIVYLRTRRARHALAALAWVAFGLLFYEKTLLVIGALAFVTLAYFTTGTLRERLVQIWRRYRASVLVSAVLGVAYLAVYATYGLSFSPGKATSTPIGPTADVMVLRSWATAVFGGPIHWSHSPASPLSFGAPSSLLVLACWVALLLFFRELVRTRTRALRALWLPGYFLACDVLLVVASRATLVGPLIGFEYRYIEEMGAVTALALALATMPILGAPEQVEVKRPSVFLDRRRPVVIACAVLVLLGTWSSFDYFQHWHRTQPAKAFFLTFFHDAQQQRPGTAVVDSAVPPDILWPLSRPANTVSHLLLPFSPQLDYTSVATDHLLHLGPDGHLSEMTVTPVHRAKPVKASSCDNKVGKRGRRIPLDGSFVYGSWWVRMGYIASADSSISVRAGGATHHTAVSSGLHTLFFEAGDEPFHSVWIGPMVDGGILCTNDVTVGQPIARTAP